MSRRCSKELGVKGSYKNQQSLERSWIRVYNYLSFFLNGYYLAILDCFKGKVVG